MSCVVGPSGIGSAAAYHLHVLARAEIGLVEDLLEAQDLHARGGGLLDERDVGLDHALADGVGRVFRVALERELDQSGLDGCHGYALCLGLGTTVAAFGHLSIQRTDDTFAGKQELLRVFLHIRENDSIPP